MICECDNCHAFVECIEHGSYIQFFGGFAPSARFSLLSCSKCSNPLLVHQVNIGNMAEGDIWDTPHRLHPNHSQRSTSNAPAAIQATFKESLACYRSKAYTATAIMCRKTLELACAEHDVKEKNLTKSLKLLRDKGVIDERLYQWSDALRLVGNEAAHGQAEAFKQADALDIVEFTNAILDYLFSFRERFENFRRRRLQSSPT